MITLEQEREVRAGLKAGLPGTVLADRVGVSTDAVYAVRKMIGVVDSISPSERREIRFHLEAGLPVGAIEARLKVPREWVYAMRRYHYIQPFRFLSRQITCPVCKSVRVIDKAFLGPKLKDEFLQEFMCHDDAIKMFRLCEDLAAMGSSGLAVNPIVYGLVKIAKSIVENFCDKNSSNM